MFNTRIQLPRERIPNRLRIYCSKQFCTIAQREFEAKQIPQANGERCEYAGKGLNARTNLPCSIIEILLLVTPARLASSRWEKPNASRISFNRTAVSKSEGQTLLSTGVLGSIA